MSQIKKTPSGIRYVSEVFTSVPSVKIEIWIKTGAIDESQNNAGIAHVIEHMLFKGTVNRSADQITDEIDRLGGYINAFTDVEETCYHIKTLSSGFEQSLHILCDMIVNPKINSNDLELEKKVILEEMKSNKDRLKSNSYPLINKAMFCGSPLNNNVLGTPTTLKRITSSKIKTFLAQNYTRDNIVVVAVGNFNESTLVDIIENNLSSLPSYACRNPILMPVYTPSYVSKVKDVNQSSIYLAVKSPPLGDRKRFPWLIADELLGGGPRSKLFRSIREEKGLAYSIFTGITNYSWDAYFYIYAGVAHDNVVDTINLIKQEIDNLRTVGISDEELEQAKFRLGTRLIYYMESDYDRTSVFGLDALHFNKIRTLEERLEDIKSVTKSELEEVLLHLSNFENYSAALIGAKRVDLKSIIFKTL